MPERNKLVSTLIILAVFVVNYLETDIETRLGLGKELGVRAAYTFRWMEGRDFFQNHDLTNDLAVYGYTTSYFFAFAVFALAMAWVFWKRQDGVEYRVLSLAVAIDYLLSLPFFLFFPVPERWTHAETGAILLSDRWSSALIEFVRPISGLDNCFPSTHTSLTVILVLMAYQAGSRSRSLALAVGLTIILSTFVLGIHWLPDIAAGIAVGVASVYLARRVDAALTRRTVAGAAAAA